MPCAADPPRLSVFQLFALALTLLLLASCGGSERRQGEGTPAEQAVGRVAEDDFESALTINAKAADRGFAIPRAATVKTSNTGHALIFVAPERPMEGTDEIPCTLQRNTSVTVRPTENTLFAFLEGDPTCGTPFGADAPTVQAQIPNATVEGRGVFTIDMAPGQTQFIVSKGSWNVTGNGQDEPRTVLPGEVLIVPRVGGFSGLLQAPLPEAAAAPPLEMLPREVQQDVKEVNRLITQFKTGPGSIDSPKFNAIRQTELVNISIDAGAGGSASDFASQQLQAMPQHLGLQGEVNLAALPSASIGNALSSGQVDLAVTRTPIPAATSLPFFSVAGEPYFLTTPGADPAFSTILRKFLVNSVESGEYARQYEEAFGVKPDYRAVRELFSLRPATQVPAPPQPPSAFALPRPAPAPLPPGAPASQATGQPVPLLSPSPDDERRDEQEDQEPEQPEDLVSTVGRLLSNLLDPVTDLLENLL